MKVVEVYDGDTIFVDINGIHPLFGKRIGIRFAEIDAPELQTTDICERNKGFKAKALVEEFVNKAHRVDIVDVKRDQYFRIVGTVLVDGKSISDYDYQTRSCLSLLRRKKAAKRLVQLKTIAISSGYFINFSSTFSTT